jgi:hypothetical protein
MSANLHSLVLVGCTALLIHSDLLAHVNQLRVFCLDRMKSTSLDGSAFGDSVIVSVDENQDKSGVA